MEPISTIIILTALVGLALWNQIREIFSESIIPWTKNHVSPEVANALSDVIVFVDQGASAIRRKAKDAWKEFNETILGSSVKIEKIDAKTAKQTTTTWVKTENGKVMKGVKEEVISYEDIPESIRSEMIRQNSKVGEMDIKEVVKEKFMKKAQEEGMVMTA
jgi:hypothetical protein